MKIKDYTKVAGTRNIHEKKIFKIISSSWEEEQENQIKSGKMQDMISLRNIPKRYLVEGKSNNATGLGLSRILDMHMQQEKTTAKTK